ncbi:MAG TPA: hypothetical protein VNJ02_04035 [Vicinamibacterales bacterium]|nr:hypothetical protein [Vicinamibacterales bacterium]
MANDINAPKDSDTIRNQNDQRTRTEVAGDTDAPDIVGRTGEEMPEVAHDHESGDTANDGAGAPSECTIPRQSDTR